MSRNPSLAVATELSTAVRGTRFLGLVADQLAATEDLIRLKIGSDIPFITDASEYIFNGGGKRVRPALLLLSSKMLGNPGDEDVTYAAVIEFIHTATLVHDDIIDDSKLRRGQSTVHNVWDNSQTVLLGDWLYTTSMKMALGHDRLDVVRKLCEATLRMTEGELMVLDRLGALNVSREEYFDIIERKTAFLFSAACSIPALAGGSETERTALDDYGRALGLCFQLVDDLLDFTESEASLGKPALSDLKGGKLTLPLILLLPRLDSGRKRWIEWVLEDRDFSRVEPQQILELVTSTGIVEEVRELAESYASAARKALQGLPAGEARDALEFAPEFVLNRRS
ncbi:MAG: polyprenyl synthetase family protein [Thermoanaerobaculia bacterium]